MTKPNFATPPLDWTMRLAELHQARDRIRKHRDRLDPGRTYDFYQAMFVQLTDEVYKVEQAWGVHL